MERPVVSTLEEPDMPAGMSCDDVSVRARRRGQGTGMPGTLSGAAADSRRRAR